MLSTSWLSCKRKQLQWICTNHYVRTYIRIYDTIECHRVVMWLPMHFPSTVVLRLVAKYLELAMHVTAIWANGIAFQSTYVRCETLMYTWISLAQMKCDVHIQPVMCVTVILVEWITFTLGLIQCSRVPLGLHARVLATHFSSHCTVVSEADPWGWNVLYLTLSSSGIVYHVKWLADPRPMQCTGCFDHEVPHRTTLSPSIPTSSVLLSYNPPPPALNTLFDNHRSAPTPKLEGITPTIQYLEMLGNANIDIVFHFSRWVLKENSEGGLKVSGLPYHTYTAPLMSHFQWHTHIRTFWSLLPSHEPLPRHSYMW